MEFKFIHSTLGVRVVGFQDYSKARCFVRESKLKESSCVWLGTDEGKMILSQEQVRSLLPILQHFVDTGGLPDKATKDKGQSCAECWDTGKELVVYEEDEGRACSVCGGK